MILGWLAGGALVGVLNALMLSSSVRRLDAANPTQGFGWLFAGAMGRWMVAAALLAAAFWRGFAEGLLALIGFWIARWVAILWWNYKG